MHGRRRAIRGKDSLKTLRQANSGEASSMRSRLIMIGKASKWAPQCSVRYSSEGSSQIPDAVREWNPRILLLCGAGSRKCRVAMQVTLCRKSGRWPKLIVSIP